MPESITDRLTDEDLYALTPAERSVIHGGARGGWVGSPGQSAVNSVERKTGLRFQSEAVRGEPRSFWSTPQTAAACKALSERIKALPRRPKTPTSPVVPPGPTAVPAAQPRTGSPVDERRFSDLWHDHWRAVVDASSADSALRRVQHHEWRALAGPLLSPLADCGRNHSGPCDWVAENGPHGPICLRPEDAPDAREPFYVSAGAERALTEAARTGRDIDVAGALYRKVNHSHDAETATTEAPARDHLSTKKAVMDVLRQVEDRIAPVAGREPTLGEYAEALIDAGLVRPFSTEEDRG